MDSQRYNELFNKFFGDFYSFLGLSSEDKVNFEFEICSNPNSLLIAIFGGKNPIYDNQNKIIASDLGYKIRPYRGMLETTIVFQELGKKIGLRII